MDWKAVIVVGLFIFVIGVLLYLPSRMWVKHKLRDGDGGRSSIRLTKTGWLLICTLVIVLFGGFSTQYIAPETAIGQLVGTSSGRFFYSTIVLLIFWVIEIVLKVRGIKLIKETRSSPRSKIN